MPPSRTKTTHRRVAPKAKSGTLAKNTVRRKKRTAVRKKQQDTSAARHTRASHDLPSWRDLATSNERDPGPSRLGTLIEKVSTVRFGLLVLVIAVVFTLYVGHVYATQDVLVELQQLRRENLRLHLKHNQLKSAFDRATGPSVVYQRAWAMGLEDGIEYGPTIEVE